MDRLILVGMFQALLDRSDEWFDPRAGHDQMDKQAWRGVAYYLAGIEPTTEPAEGIARILNEVNPK